MAAHVGADCFLIKAKVRENLSRLLESPTSLFFSLDMTRQLLAPLGQKFFVGPN